MSKNVIIHNQTLISPLEIKCSALDKLTIMDNKDILQNNGFYIKEIDGNFVLTTLPYSKNTSFTIDDMFETLSLI